MTMQFEYIKIVEIDDKASGPSGLGALMNIVFRLSQSAPYEWAQYFEIEWARHIYMMKRDASVSGDRLTITCVPDELEADHIPELKKIIGRTNEAYLTYHAAKQHEEQAAAEQERQQKETISKLKTSIKFD